MRPPPEKPFILRSFIVSTSFVLCDGLIGDRASLCCVLYHNFSENVSGDVSIAQKLSSLLRKLLYAPSAAKSTSLRHSLIDTPSDLQKNTLSRAVDFQPQRDAMVSIGTLGSESSSLTR